ncbi:MAG: hypothetical protein K8R86_09090, partial [Bacteroidales bacterium]|nr:hypothetical protein [Bacteroidales bacterium]
KGHKITFHRFGSKDNLYDFVKYKYGLKGDLIESKEYDSDNSLTEKINYKYDDENNIIEMKHYYPFDGSIDIKTYKYDRFNNEIEESYKATKNWINDYEIDDKYKFDYKYDKNGNWIYCLYYLNGFPKNITIREIEYY